jgi:hypothetical protein
MTTQGPFLYDDNPEPLHTGTPRRSGKLLVLIFAATVVVAVLMAILLPLVKGSAADQAKEVTGVFLTALDKGDTTTAHQLLCEAERNRLNPDQISAKYVAGHGVGRVDKVEDSQFAGKPSQDVDVSWPGGGKATLVVVNTEGLRICGVR